MIMFGAHYALMRSLLIATRYAACRRQFQNEKGSKKERKLLDYQTHMHILGPHLANAYLIQICGRAIEDLINLSNTEVEKGNFKLLDISHHYTSGMKAMFTDMCYQGTDECRKSAGGYGYHKASGLVDIFCDNAVMSTYEGVNVILYQQSSRYVFKLMKKLR